MIIEVPLCQRCCFCLPLRMGIIAFGSINILWSTLMTVTMIYKDHTILRIHGTVLDWGEPTAYIARIIDIVISAVLVVGGYKNLTVCLKVFFYYTCLTILAIFVIQIYALAKLFSYNLLIETGLFIISTILHVYLLLQINSLVNKINKTASETGYDNQLGELGAKHIEIKNGSTDATVHIE
ncbi:uncharacterized protein LOC125052063 isoform X3 [Pieris napi]|uniref:uncharacterized protein LOC125052063 isoform X3 n=1 Tax=Pieris napi TaxID=78633 RepID=UPI001FBB40FF|nr:uncharacterized protein LOC125052063 isoform X3 [Pieris napi]